MISISETDSARFGIVCARAEHLTLDTLPELQSFCRSHAVKFLIARCDVNRLDVAQALEESGCRLMDTIVWLSLDLSKKRYQKNENIHVREIRPGDELRVQEISRSAFQNYTGGHYHSDKRIDRDTCADIYSDWAYQSCVSKTVADHVLVAECEGRVVGFITLKSNGNIPLNAVSPDMQRRGIYRSLLEYSIFFLANLGATQARISTQLNNVAVQKVCQRLGFEPAEAVYTFHRWL